MGWKTNTALGQMPSRQPLMIFVNGRWESTTPYELLNAYRFPRFLSIGEIEFAMDTEIRRASEMPDCPPENLDGIYDRADLYEDLGLDVGRWNAPGYVHA